MNEAALTFSSLFLAAVGIGSTVAAVWSTVWFLRSSVSAEETEEQLQEEC